MAYERGDVPEFCYPLILSGEIIYDKEGTDDAGVKRQNSYIFKYRIPKHAKDIMSARIAGWGVQSFKILVKAHITHRQHPMVIDREPLDIPQWSWLRATPEPGSVNISITASRSGEKTFRDRVDYQEFEIIRDPYATEKPLQQFVGEINLEEANWVHVVISSLHGRVDDYGPIRSTLFGEVVGPHVNPWAEAPEPPRVYFVPR